MRESEPSMDSQRHKVLAAEPRDSTKKPRQKRHISDKEARQEQERAWSHCRVFGLFYYVFLNPFFPFLPGLSDAEWASCEY
jgi:hypothetical protein